MTVRRSWPRICAEKQREQQVGHLRDTTSSLDPAAGSRYRTRARAGGVPQPIPLLRTQLDQRSTAPSRFAGRLASRYQVAKSTDNIRVEAASPQGEDVAGGTRHYGKGPGGEAHRQPCATR